MAGVTSKPFTRRGEHARRAVHARLTAGAAFLVASALALSGCAGAVAGAGDAPAADYDAVYRLPIFDPGSTIDPLTNADPYAQAISGLVTEPLVSLDASGDLLPRLATDWTASEDGLVWTVELRPGAEFNNGNTVTARDVAATFEQIIAVDSLSPGRAAFDGVLEEVVVQDDHRVDFVLVRPFSDFPLLLTGANTGILPADSGSDPWLENPIGAGQFLLEDYTIGRGATYVKNPRYWNADAIDIDGVELKIYGDFQASLLAFQAGELDRIGLTSEVSATVDLADYNVISSGFNRIDGVFLDVTTPPFDDESARQALAWAIDREGIVEDVYAGNADVGNDTMFLPDYATQPDGLPQRDRDLDKVRELLDGRTLEFTITTSYQLLGEVLQQQLNAVPGFDVGLEVLTNEEYYADGPSTPWLHSPVTVTSWAKRGPTEYLSLVYSEGGAMNASHYANPELDALAARFDATTNEADRRQLAGQIAEIQYVEVPVIVPAFSKSRAVQTKRVHGEFLGALDYYTGYNFAGISIVE